MGYKRTTHVSLFWLMKVFLLGGKQTATDHWSLTTANCSTPVLLLREPFHLMIAIL